MEKTSELVVYKASAGSGKTFTLAVEYIKLLIDNPWEYRSILAVTFTNKATGEMKERILSQLFGIATGDKNSDGYFHAVQQSTGKTEQEIREKAQTALNYIIHDYSHFRVETIDSFFQSVMRNLARELELNANLNIELNNEEALGEAVDVLLEKLDRHSPVLSWILEYINEQIKNDKNWNVSHEIKRFGMNIFNEDFVERGGALRDKLQDKSFLYHYRNDLKELQLSILDQMGSFADQFFDVLESRGLEPTDLKQGNRGISSYFRKMKEGKLTEKDRGATVDACLKSPEEWATKTSKLRNEIIELAETELIPLLQTCEEFRKKNNVLLNSCELSLKYINTLQLLNNISTEVHIQNQQKNRFLLAETNALLHKLLRQDDSSFVFEKIGTNIKHVMIDEFQDTSKMQWNNFKMLLLEGLSQGENSLIVGDVKQSIYRWRGGDWNILNNLNRRIDAFPIRTINLQTNRRSAPNIIQFNNQFFPKACRHLYELYKLDNNDLKKAYEDVGQQWIEPQNSNQSRGYVKVEFLENTPEKTYADLTLEKLAEEAGRLIENGARPADIAILVRKRKDIPAIADYFNKNTSLTLISDEAFRLESSQAVCMLIDALRYLVNPEDAINKANLAIGYQRIIHPEQTDINTILLEQTNRFLPKELVQQQNELRMMPLYELLEQLYRLFYKKGSQGEETAHNQDAYLLNFFDHVLNYLKENSSDLSSFLLFWEEELYKKTIPASEQDGIRIMTIHSSKGLEFLHVLIPFCDWKLTGEKSSLVWCSTEYEPFSKLNLTPVAFKESMAESVFRQDYYHELLQLLVDNLNILYVAFTRPKQNLIVLSKQKATKGSVAQMLQKALTGTYTAQGATLPEQTDYEWDMKSAFEYGVLKCSLPENESANTNLLLKKPERCLVNMTSEIHHAAFLQSNKSAQFIDGKAHESDKNQFIDQGLLLHSIFSGIYTADDTDKVISHLQQEGVITSLHEADQLKKFVHKALMHPQAKDWFSGKYNLYNECKIVWMKEGKVVENRPDRVMTNETETIVVDFKFGSAQKKYRKQVGEYIQLLEKMNYPNVKGYIWYVYSGQIESV